MIWTQDENGEWNSDKDRQLGVPDTFYKIAIEEKHSRFDKTRIRYSVITVGTDERGYYKDFTLKRFISRKHAQAFADKLAALLNKQEE